MEPVTLGLGAVAAYLSKDGVEKLLGPTADYLGKSLAEFTQKRVENVGKIFKNAEEKLGEKLDNPGEVPPKVLKAVIDEGSFSGDQLAIEYFGGILASSRTENGRDDRGARLAKMVDALSTYQLRTHFLIYGTIRRLFANKGLSMDMDGRPKMQIFVPYESFLPAMEFSENEMSQGSALMAHIFFGLTKDDLISSSVMWGSKEHLSKVFPQVPDHGLICGPSSLGVELFLGAFGHSDKEHDFIFDPHLNAQLEGIPPFFETAIPTGA